MNNNYENEVRELWSNTDVYREHISKTKSYTKEKWTEANEGLMSVFTEFFTCKENGFTADSEPAQQLVSRLKAHITENYYVCTDEILAGLGRMYVCDERFKNNINKVGAGTAEYAAAAIATYCD